jgi:predicted nucleic acid-binding protein
VTAGRSPAVVDTNVFGAELTQRGASVAAAYRRHVEGRDLFISFITMAELRYGALLAAWGERRLARFEARISVAEIVWSGEGLVDTYVSFRNECTLADILSGRRCTKPTVWSRQRRVG